MLGLEIGVQRFLEKALNGFADAHDVSDQEADVGAEQVFLDDEAEHAVQDVRLADHGDDITALLQAHLTMATGGDEGVRGECEIAGGSNDLIDEDGHMIGQLLAG